MEVFNFCWMILLHESKKFNMFFDKSTCNVKNNIDQDFTRSFSRIAYLYKFGSYNISLFNQGFKEFYTKVPDSSKIIDDFLAIKNLTICSMSVGSGTDIIALLYSLHQVDKPLANSSTFRVISKFKGWRTIVTDMINSSSISVPDGSTCDLIQCKFLRSLSKEARSYLVAADILLMCSSFSSSKISEKRICHISKRTFDLLKPGALVFLMFSKEKSTYFKELESLGSFLYGPVEVILENMPYDEKIAELVGVKPLDSGKSMFAVWKKLLKNNPELNVEKDTENSFIVEKDYQSSTKFINKCEVKDINSPILSLSGLKREFLSDTNVSSSDSIASSSHFSSSRISSKIISRKDGPVVPDNSVSFNVQNINSSESHANSLAKKGSSLSLTASESLEEKDCASPCKGSQKKIENKENDMNSLLKNLESLMTKFEGLISSKDSLKPCSVEETQTSSCQQNLHQDHNAKLCQFKGNSSTCCHSMACYNDNIHYCSTNFARPLPFRALPQDGPCLVIPLQNLSNESLTHILSIISQNSSVNKT